VNRSEGNILNSMFRDDSELKMLYNALTKAMANGSSELGNIEVIWKKIALRQGIIRKKHGESYPSAPLIKSVGTQKY